MLSRLALATLGLTALAADAMAGECRVANFRFTPAPDLQIAVWIEDAAGNFVDTVYVTRMTGTYGLGNRPGRFDFNSSYLWPYGRRENVLPIWAHRRGVEYPLLVYQDSDDNDLSHPLNESSDEPYYCRPLQTGEPAYQNSIDTGSCATTAFTDKGMFSPSRTSVYPPRNDLTARMPADSADMMQFAALNDLDAVSRATPPGGEPYTLLWAPPSDLPPGDYVAWIEVSREYDFNADWNPGGYPSPEGIPWSNYGEAYRGQPSVVWRLPFSLGDVAEGSFQVLDYAGYGDPAGLDGTITPPDATITQVEGSYTVPAGPGGVPPSRTVTSLGAARLLVESSTDGAYKFRVELDAHEDPVAPAAPRDLAALDVQASEASLTVRAPGDDGDTGQAAQYDIRVRAGAPLDADNFERDGLPIDAVVRPVTAGETQTFMVDGLLPETRYWVGVRAKDDCLNAGPVTFIEFTTPRAPSLEVDACFVATAAWGSLMEPHVGILRHFRDRVLRGQVLGELFVEAYYTFGPALAQVIRPSTTLRAATRRGLGPLVDFARALTDDAPTASHVVTP